MELSNQASQCPGLKLGHKKTHTSTATPHKSTNIVGTAGTEQKRIIKANYTSNNIHSSNTMPGYFRLPEYEPTRLQLLPAAPQTLFQKEQLQAMLDDFSKHMHEAIVQNQIQLPPSIELSLNSMGNINVLGNHPDQPTIANLFTNNSPLELQFHQIAFTSRLQQLANLQPGFKGEFFKYPNHSIEQITFVHLRAVELKPFHMTIGQPKDLIDPALDKQIPRGEFPPFHLVISKRETSPALSPVADNPVPSKPEENIYTIDDPKPPRTVQPEPHKEEKSHHRHKGKLKCIINS
ncbi:MAG: hypothetical protein OEX12_03625 [Gammaproteobacteria bacterium]|nr:hypothetical protein [Gammaproteobacteria bacterium]